MRLLFVLLMTVFSVLSAEAKPRILVSTDAGGADKDDLQSLVHLFLYADVLDIRAIVSSPPKEGRVRDILEVVDYYAVDYNRQLRHYSPSYPTPREIRSMVYQGHKKPAPKNGYSNSTPGSKIIVSEAKAASPTDPLWVLLWGSAADLAQALHDEPSIAGNIRVYASSTWNTRQDPHSRDYIIENMKQGRAFEDLLYIESVKTHQGVYLPDNGARTPEIHIPWINEHVAGHGLMGEFFANEASVDMWGNGDVHGIRMSDTASVLYVLDNETPDDPTVSNWGGRFVKDSDVGDHYYTDHQEPELALGEFVGARTVAEHRPEYFADFAARFDRIASE